VVGDFEEVERLQAGIREWVLRAVRSGRHELRDVPARAVLPLLCAAAFGAALGDAADPAAAPALAPAFARIGVLASVGADTLAGVLGDAAERVRAARAAAEPSYETRYDLPRETRYDLQREIRRSISEILAASGEHADGLRSDIAMVMREIDAGGTLFRAAIEAGNEQAEREVVTAVEAVSTEFGDMAFMLADLVRAAVEVQDSLGGQGTELRAASEQVGRQSADVRMIREELAAIERRTRHWMPAAGAGEDLDQGWAGGCPYRGLLPYDQAHKAVFFGRERLTAELAGKLAETGVVMVSGGSGVGKTSLLQAGLVPALARGVQLPGSPAWPRISITATERPLTELAAKLAALGGGDPAAIRRMLADAPDEAHLLVRDILLATAAQLQEEPGYEGRGRLILIIDQFEQVFAADDQDGRLERAAFIDAVCAAANEPAGSYGEPPARVVIAVRGDYWDRCAAYPQLVRAMEQDQLVVGPMPEAGLRRAIAGPAEVSGLRIESALIDAILADARAAGIGVLPRLSQAMMATWEKREGDLLTAEGYDRSGRVAGAIEVSAEAVYDRLPDGQKAVARDMLRQLTGLGPDRRPVRRPVTQAGLHAGAGPVLDAFAGSQLVIMGAGVAGIAHDVLLEAWPRLRDWLEEDQASMILRGQLAEDTTAWRKDGKDSAVLYQGVKLAAARQAVRGWEADPGRYPALTPPEAAFLRASGRAATRGRWGRRTLAAALIVLLVAALAGAGLAVRSARNTASQQRTTDLSGRLAAQSTALDTVDPLTAALLAGAAWRVAPTAQADYSLLESLAQPVRGILTAQSGVVTALAYAPGGQTLATGYTDGAIRLWDLASHRLISSTTWGSAVLTLTFTDGGKTLEAADTGAIGRWNLTAGAKISTLPLGGASGSPSTSSPATSGASTSGASTSGASAGGGGGAVAFSPDGKILATGGEDGNLRLWDTATEQEIGAPMSSDLQPVDAVAFSPDGTTVAAASSDGTVQLWDVATQQEAGSGLAASSAAVKTLMFSPDGKTLATGDENGNLRLWDIATLSRVGATMATGDSVAALAFSADGTTLATAESDGSTELWDVTTHHQTGAPLAAQSSGGVSAVAFSPDASGTGAGNTGAGNTGAGNTGAGEMATGNGDGSVQLWNPAGFHQASAPLAVGTLEPPAIAAGYAPVILSASGDIAAATGYHGTVRLWNTLTRRAIGMPIAGHRVVKGLAISPDGKTLAVAADGLQLWATATGQQLGSPLPASDVGGPVAFSPDGALLATIGRDGKARLWDTATQKETGSPMTVGGPGALAFSPDGKTLAAVGTNGNASLWSVATQKETGAAMAAGSQPASGPGTAAVAFSRDGRTLATASGNGTVRVWDVATQAEIGAPMTAGTQPVYAVAFNPDGTMLATAGGDGTARLWDVTFPAGLLTAACAIADQSFTRQQWADYAGTQPFQQVCPAS
jgi:WD40 repeat protein